MFERFLKWLRGSHDQPTTPPRPELTPEEEEARRRSTDEPTAKAEPTDAPD